MNTVADTIKTQFTERKDDIVGIFLITGIVLVSAIAWTQILRPIGKAVESAVDTATGG